LLQIPEQQAFGVLVQTVPTARHAPPELLPPELLDEPPSLEAPPDDPLLADPPDDAPLPLELPDDPASSIADVDGGDELLPQPTTNTRAAADGYRMTTSPNNPHTTQCFSVVRKRPVRATEARAARHLIAPAAKRVNVRERHRAMLAGGGAARRA
jgi:hypothetical protein